MPKFLHLLTSLATLASVGAQDRPPGAERGQGPPHHRPKAAEFIGRLDLDKDGKLSREEFDKGDRVSDLEEEIRAKIFARLDKDDDGFITQKDLKKIPPPKNGRHEISRSDENKDGRISFEEFSKSPRLAKLPEERRKEMFAHFDRNGNGFLDPRDHPQDRPDGKRGGRHPMPRIKLEGLDLDGNGSMSWAEFQNAPAVIPMHEKNRRHVFERLDADKNGELSAEELRLSSRGPGRDGKGPERSRKGPKK